MVSRNWERWENEFPFRASGQECSHANTLIWPTELEDNKLVLFYKESCWPIHNFSQSFFLLSSPNLEVGKVVIGPQVGMAMEHIYGQTWPMRYRIKSAGAIWERFTFPSLLGHRCEAWSWSSPVVTMRHLSPGRNTNKLQTVDLKEGKQLSGCWYHWDARPASRPHSSDSLKSD